MASQTTDSSNRKPPVSPRPQSASPKPSQYPSLIDCEPPSSIRSPIVPQQQGSKRSNSLSEKSSKQRVRSASAGRSPRHDLQARYWALLFENLHRAVDEIYQTCETDQSVAECKEAVLMLDIYAKEFRSLIDWLKLSKDLEKIPPPNRPTSLSWEVRKSSPGKGFLRTAFLNYINSSCRKGSLDFHSKSGVPVPSGIESDNLDKSNSKKSCEIEPIEISCITEKDNSVVVIHENSENPQTNIDAQGSLPVEESNKVSVFSDNVTIDNVIPNPNPMIPKSLSLDLENQESKQSELDLNKTDFDISVQETEDCAQQELHTKVEDLDNTILLNTTYEKLEIRSSELLKDHTKVDDLDNTILLNTTYEKLEIKSSELLKDQSLNESHFLSNMKNLQVDVELNIDVNEISIPDNSAYVITNLSEEKSEPLTTLISPLSDEKSDPLTAVISAPSEEISDSLLTVKSTASSEKSVPVTMITCNPPTDKSEPTPTTTSNTTTATVKNIPNQPTPVLTTRPTPSTTSSISKSTNANKPSTFASTVTTQSVRNSVTNSNRPNPQGIGRQTPIHPRPNYQNKANTEPKKVWPDRRSGFNSTARRGGLGYQSASFKGAVDRKPYTAVSSRTAPAPVVGSGSNLTKDQQKTGSTSSISSTSSGQSWADKVKGVSSTENTPTSKTKAEEDDNDGWETVHRGRARSRTSPIKNTPINLLSSSLSNLKEEEPIRKPPLLRRVHTEVNTFSARNSKLASNFDAHKKISAPKSAPFVKSVVNRTVKKEMNTAAKPSTILLKTKPVLSSKVLTSTRDGKISSVKRMPEISRKRPADVKAVIDTNIKRPAKVCVEKGNSLDEGLKETKKAEAECDASEVNKIEDSELSEKELLLSGLDKEEELGSFEANSEEESDLILEENFKKDLEHETAEKLSEDDSAEKPLEDDDEIREIISPNSDLGDDTEEELNTFDDNQIDWDDYRRHKIDQIHQLGLNWGDQMDQLDLELRTPGRAPQMHEKLSSPFRKRSTTETLQRQEEKLAKAQEQRERLLEEKAQKFKDIAKKAEEIRLQKEEQQEQLRLSMLMKLQKAEEKRKMQLQKIVRKAHDEEEKVNEIAFINTLEAQNKRHDIRIKEKDHELRLTEIQEERQRKLDEKAAKEAAAEERRKALEAERQSKLQEMQEKRKLKDQKIELQFQEKEKERQEIANQKARDREQRLSALCAAHQANVEELQKKIQQKQEDSARRHEENMEQIRLKAFELSIRCYSSNNDDAPLLVPYETKKLCTLCSVLIESEVYLLSHLRGKKHQDAVKDQHQGMEPPTEALELYNIKHIIEAPADQIDPNIALDKERQKALKKRCKKIKQRLITKGQEWEKQNTDKVPTSNSTFKQKFQKSIRDLQRHLLALSSSSWESNIVTSLERLLGECERALDKGQRDDKLLFQQLGGTAALLQMLQQILLRVTPTQTPQVVPDKTLVRAAVVYRLACINCSENSLNTLLSNKLVTLLDLLIHRLKELVPDNRSLSNSANGPSSVPVDPVAGALLGVLATALHRPFIAPEAETADIRARVQDVVGYAVSVGVVDKLSHYLSHVRGPLDAEPQAADFVLNVLTFLTALAARLQGNRYTAVFEQRKEDETQLLATFQVTELSATVSVLYGMLLHGGAPPRGGSTPPVPMTPVSLALSLAGLRMLNRIALLDYQMLQGVLGREGLSLQLRHIASYLLWFCSHLEHPELLHEVILLVGYFALLHTDNQVVLQSGQCPSVLQQLCSLPFQYFSDPALTRVLFPTLVACCFNSPENRFILEQEMSPELLANYIEASLLDIHQDSLSGRTEQKGEEEQRFSLMARFPKSKWTAAKHFFEDRTGAEVTEGTVGRTLRSPKTSTRRGSAEILRRIRRMQGGSKNAVRMNPLPQFSCKVVNGKQVKQVSASKSPTERLVSDWKC